MALIGFRNENGTITNIGSVVKDSSYKSKLSLALIKNVGVTGLVSWVDMLAEHDAIRTEFDIELLNGRTQSFEESLKNIHGGALTDIRDKIVITDAVGFYPLTPLYSSNTANGEYQLSIENYPKPKNVNIFSDAVHYSLKSFPNGDDPTLATPIEVCRASSGWTLDGLDLPYPKDKISPLLNKLSKSNQLNKGVASSFRYGVVGGETVRLGLSLDDEGARLLLAKLTAIRGSTFTVIAPSSYNLFAHLYPNNTNFKCILNSNVIDLDYSNHNDIKVSFSIQLLEVNS